MSILGRNNKTSPGLASSVVSLPSNGVFYESRQSTVQIRHFNVGQIAAIDAAVKTKSEFAREKHFANIIGESLLDFNVLDLTLQDYRFIQYWLRINSYPSIPYLVTWEYSEGEDTYKVFSNVTQTSLEIVEVESHKENLRADLDFARVRDKLDLLQIMEESPDDAQKIYLAKLALNMAGSSLQEKIAKLRVSPAAILADLENHVIEFNHGVTEIAFLSGEVEVLGVKKLVESKVKLDLALQDFFP